MSYVKNETRWKPAAAMLWIAFAVLAGCTPPTGNPAGGDQVQDPTRGTVLSVRGTRPGDLSRAAAGPALPGERAEGEPIVLDATGIDGSVVGTVTLTGARFVVEEFEFESESESGDENLPDQETGYEFEGPYLADLIAGTVTPSFETIDLPEGTYGKIEFKIRAADGSEDDGEGGVLVASSDPLYGNSVVLSGTYSGSTAAGTVTGIPFSVQINAERTFELKRRGENPVGFSVDADTLNRIIIAFRTVRWFAFDDPETNDAGIDFSSLMPFGSAVRLDSASTGDNLSILNTIIANLEKSADYGKDADGDGELESSEDDDPDDHDENDD